MKICSKCGFEGEDELFTKSKRGSRCKKCTQIYVKERRDKLREEMSNITKTCSKCGFTGDGTHFRLQCSICLKCNKEYMKGYRDDIPDEKRLIYNKKSKESYHHRMGNDPEYKENRRINSLLWVNDNRIKVLLNRVRNRAKKKGMDFDLTKDDITIPDRCPVLDIPLVWSSYTDGRSPSIDRIDSTRGYTKDNIMIISVRANTLKNSATKEEMALLYNFYVKDNDFDF